MAYGREVDEGGEQGFNGRLVGLVLAAGALLAFVVQNTEDGPEALNHVPRDLVEL